jgi:hypothetical protein
MTVPLPRHVLYIPVFILTSKFLSDSPLLFTP